MKSIKFQTLEEIEPKNSEDEQVESHGTAIIADGTGEVLLDAGFAGRIQEKRRKHESGDQWQWFKQKNHIKTDRKSGEVDFLLGREDRRNQYPSRIGRGERMLRRGAK